MLWEQKLAHNVRKYNLCGSVFIRGLIAFAFSCPGGCSNLAKIR
jgi:hypothetical protein